VNILVVSPQARGTPATGVIATVASIEAAIAKARELGYALDAAVIDTSLDGAAFHAACPSVAVVALDDAAPITIELAVTRARLSDVERMLVGMLGHDVRSPLHAITLGCDLLDARVPDAAPAIDRVRRAGERAISIVDDLLDAAQLRLGGELAMTSEPVELAELVERIVADQRAAQPKRRIELAPLAAITVRADPARLERVIANVIAYVTHQTAAGARVSVEIAGGDRAVVIARCDGPLGEPRANSSVAIGLAVGAAVLRAHGGTLAIQGDGIRVELPLR
jgi:two-component system sensor histidine kinase MtrB